MRSCAPSLKPELRYVKIFGATTRQSSLHKCATLHICTSARLCGYFGNSQLHAIVSGSQGNSAVVHIKLQSDGHSIFDAPTQVQLCHDKASLNVRYTAKNDTIIRNDYVRLCA